MFFRTSVFKVWHPYFLFSDQQLCFANNNGNGFCDDANNHIGCDFDGGDCCGSCVVTVHCSQCVCLGGADTINVLVGDGFCNDETNNANCHYDGGDCCGYNINNDLCSNCTCLGMAFLT